jgi:hypothetical protein
MTSIPIASSFLAGSILSLLMPTLMFIGLTVWYVKFVKRVPDTKDGGTTEPPAGAPPDAAAPQSQSEG